MLHEVCQLQEIHRVVLNGRLGKNNKKLIAYVLLYCDVHSTLAYEHLKIGNKRFVIARL